MLITAKQINEMVQEIEAGMKIYINRDTLEIIPIFDWEESFGDTEEWEEEQEEGAEEETPITPSYGRYGRLAAWIKSTYGDRFRDGSTTEEVKQQLEKVIRERERMGDFRDNPAIFKGFRAYIDLKEYGELVRIRE